MLNINGMVKVPWKLQFTGIFRAQTSQHRTMLIRMHLGERWLWRILCKEINGEGGDFLLAY